MTDEEFQVRPASRYGDRDGRSRTSTLVLAVLGVLALVAVTAWVWASTVGGESAITYELVGFDEVTDRSVQIRFRVERDAGVAVTCVVRARNLAGEEVGRDRVDIGAAGQTRVEVTEELRTTDRPVSAEVVSCAEPG